MSTTDPDDVVADERVAERRYNEWLEEKASRAQRNLNSQIQNTWTESPRAEFPRSGTLVGRVRLVESSDMIGGDQFYIGSARGQANGIPVYSYWAPLFGEAFYLGGRIEHLGDLHGVRTLDRAGSGHISMFEDQTFSADSPNPLFPRGALQVPKPTVRIEPILRGAGVGEVEQTSPSPREAPSTPRRAAGERSTEAPAPQPRESRPTAPMELRAAPVLLHRLGGPKRGDLSPVLATLQPDQYRAITRAATESVVFQGHPGTGKTIIAVHRLAYLTSREAAERRATGLVMLVGPTREYAEHVRPAVRALTGEDDNVVVMSLPALFHEFAGIRANAHADTRVEDGRMVSDEATKYLRVTYNALRGEGVLDGVDRLDAVQAVYERLRTSPAFPDGDAIDADWYRYLRALPPFEAAVTRPELLPVLAYFGLRFKKPYVYTDAAHIIVDEGQDVHPLEWEILGRLGPSQGWTILGDLNQRRSQLTYRSWKPVAFALSIDDEGKAPVVALERGYRSTAAIMRLANRLLPASDRRLNSLQSEGPDPIKVRAPQRDKLVPYAVEQATQLCRHYADGSVAIIAAATHAIQAGLRRAGWSAESLSSQSWTFKDHTLRLLSHDQARGLEFDAVVVVEPADFPVVEGEGKLGSLYTSLTRANRELVIVNHKALPEALRGQ